MRVRFARFPLFSGVMTIALGATAGASALWRIAPALSAPVVFARLSLRLEVKPVGLAKLPGSFVSPQALYADSERIYACSYQGDLFVLERNRQKSFPVIQTIRLGVPLTAVHGDANHLYVTARDGNLFVLSKSKPLQIVKSIQLSSYGLGAVHAVGKHVYVGKGQASMTASDRYLYLSSLNPGDSGLEVWSRKSYGDSHFESGKTLVFDRQNLQFMGSIPNGHPGGVHVTSWQDFVYLTTPGCCGAGIDVYNANTLERVQFIRRSTNTVVGIRKNGVSLLVGGTERGTVDWYLLDDKGYQFGGTVDLPRLTGFTGRENIEIRSLWVDGLDNLVFAGSSWGNDESRSPELPSLFILEIL